MKKILVTMPFTDEHKTWFEEIAAGCEVSYVPTAEVTAEDVQDVEVIVGNVKPALVQQAAGLKWIQLNSAGYDPYCKPGIIGPDTILTCATGAYGLSVSEYMVAVSFMLARKMDLYMQNQGSRCWHPEGKVVSIWESTTLVVGLGDIGAEYAKRMKALGSHVIGVKRSLIDKPEYLDELHTMEELDTLLPRADFIAMILPSSPETHHLMDERRLSLIKPTAFLINAGRGDAIDGAALNLALREGKLGGCALDVTEPEPLPADDPLWDAPRTIITPHVAGNFYLQETVNRIVRIAGENLRQYLAGAQEHMRNQVDTVTGNRKS